MNDVAPGNAVDDIDDVNDINVADDMAFLTADACMIVPGQGVRAASRDGGGSKTCPEGLQRVVAVAPPRQE